MAGRIRAEDVQAVKERSSITDVVREHVSLRPAGIGSMKGLCPFHDEKTPSFTVRETVGAYHCFGCGEGGDVISFVQKLDHLTFAESVERLAGKLGMELRYDEGGGPRDGVGLGKRSRLIEAHRAAAEFYHSRLLETPEARIGRDFLRERGFASPEAKLFGIGYAPRSGEELARYLRGKGFTDDELTIGGLCGRGSRGLYDRFRGRLIWPIRDITGDTIGFGARHLWDNDRIGAKYLNTTETPIYKKSTVLYGLDLAKKSIRDERQVVVVEGYTDVMAAHLAGVQGAVATCGTSFGEDHIKVIRRIVRDEADLAPAKVIFTFDGDKAGQGAAMKAYAQDDKWASQSFVAVAKDGMDPCDLRLREGDAAVRDLVEDAVPMFEFAVRTTLARFDLQTAEGRVRGMGAVAPIINSIRDSSLRPEYVRTVAGWVGVEVEQMRDAVTRAGRIQARADSQGDSRANPETPEPTAGEAASGVPAPDLRDPIVKAERQLLQSMLQHPSMFSSEDLDAVEPEGFAAPAHRAVFAAVREVGPLDQGVTLSAWHARIDEATPLAVAPLVAELSVAPLPVVHDQSTGAPPPHYTRSLLVRVREVAIGRRISDAMSQMRRLAADPSSDQSALRELSLTLQGLERERVSLRTELQ
ncbi:DNA primase [Janibacter sp. Soil728]|uniref:DNA primase n=1 Tax=Janibacter sp. Soil728 TaxID=1736393 RepID=UPI0006FD6F3A|nr:DNA primase [Janibacter sp. Soil728]KRE37969.1 DNA primase [Janibacter sp. Soil728]